MSNINGLCVIPRSCAISGRALVPGGHRAIARASRSPGEGKTAARTGTALSPSTFPENHRDRDGKFFSSETWMVVTT